MCPLEARKAQVARLLSTMMQWQCRGPFLKLAGPRTHQPAVRNPEVANMTLGDTEKSRLGQQARLALLIGLGVALVGSIFGLVGGIVFGPVRGAEAVLIGVSTAMSFVLIGLVLRHRQAATSWIPGLVSLYFLGHLLVGSALAIREADSIIRVAPYLFWYFPLLCFNKFTNFGTYRQQMDHAITTVPLLSLLIATPRIIAGAEVAEINLLVTFFLSFAGFAYFLELFSRYRDGFVGAQARAEASENLARALGESENRYRTIYDLVPVLIWEEDWSEVKPLILDLQRQGVIDFDSYMERHPDFVTAAIRKVKVLDANLTGATMFGVETREDLLTSHGMIIENPSAQLIFRKALIAYATGQREIETEEVTFDLQSRKLNIFVKMALPDITSDETRVVLTEMDVTALRKTDERLRLLGQATHDTMWEHDLKADDLWVGEGILKRFGHKPEDLIVQRKWEALLHPADRPRVTASQKAAIESDAVEWMEIYRFRRADDSYAHVRDHALILRDRNGSAERMIGSITDITEQTDLEEQLRQSQRLEAVGQLTGGIAHDFNNLLTVIIGNAEMLEERLHKDPIGRGLAEMTRVSGERAAELTSRLLSFSRLQPLQPRQTNIPARIEDLKDLLRRSLGEQVELQIAEGPAPWLVMVDPPQLDAAILNICINSRDAMPKGGHLTISCQNECNDNLPAEALAQGGDFVALSFTDTGTGMDETTVARAFEPFFTTKDVGKGSGLGLSMVYGFVRQSGGAVTLTSALGQGTTVTLYLPRASDNLHSAEPILQQTAVPTGQEHILAVEDNDLVRDNLVGQLKSLGYQVTAAADGAEALALLPDLPGVKLLLTDVVMPGGVSGWDLARRALAERPDLKVLFSSGHPLEVMVREGAQITPDQILNKPYRRQVLAKKLRQVLDGQAAPE